VKEQSDPHSLLTPILTGVSAAIGVLVIVGSLWLMRGSAYFQFHFNGYALLSLVSAFADIVLLIYINRPQWRAPETFWFSVFLCEVILWGLLEGIQRLSTNPVGASFWYSLTAFAWVLFGVTLYIYALTMTRRMDSIRNVRGILAVVGVPILFWTLLFRTDLLVDYNPAHAISNPWGYYFPYRGFFAVFIIWLEIFLLSSLFLMYQHYRTTTDPVSKRRALFNIVGICVPLVGGSMTDAFLPLFHIRVLPVAVLLTTVMTLIIGYAILRYKIFAASPSLIANNVLDGMSEAVLILDNEFQVEYANPSSSRLLEYTPQELEQYNLEQLLAPDDYTILTEELAAPIVGNNMLRNRVAIVNKQKQLVPAVLSINRLTSTGNRQDGYVVVATDVSAIERIAAENRQLEEAKLAMLNALEDAQELEHALEKEKTSVEHKVVERTEQLSKEQARLQASINSLQIGFIITDERNALLSANTAASTILGSTHKDNLTDLLAKLKPILDVQAKIEQAVEHGKPVTINEVLMENRYLQIVITPVLLNARRAIGAVTLIQDITEAKALQRSRDEFFSIASHELRTPLTAIRGNSSLIQMYFSEALKGHDDLRELIDDIHVSSVRLIDIVNDFLNVSRLEQGNVELDIQPITIKPIVESVANEIISMTQEKNVKIINKLTGKYTVLADADRVKQVIYNFIGNAMKFTEHGSITISSEVEGKKLKVLISDTGGGIAADRQHLLFHKFQQASDNILTRDATRGTGLGLYISKLLVEKMHGKIRLEHSEVGKGTTFSFTLPLAKASKD